MIITPYYEDNYCTIYHGDCLEIIPQLEPVDLVLTDPPYCSGAHESQKRGKRNNLTPESIKVRPIIEMDSMGTLGFEWVTRKWFLTARKITNQSGHLACFTDWRMYPQISILLEAAGWRLTNLIIWDKGYPGLGSGFRAQHEFVSLSSNGQPKWYSYDYGNVLKNTRLTKTQHPHEKPIELLEKLIKTCSQENNIILDPFMGSGTTLIATQQLNRKAIGIEIEEKYCEIAVKRLAQEVLAFK